MCRTRMVILITFLLMIISGCDVLSSDTEPDKPVTFTIMLDASVFSTERPVRFVFWSEEQLLIAQENANCAISYDAETETEEVQCPEGVVYQPVTPNEFTIARDEISERLNLTPGNIFVGQRYRLQISGLNSDNCNTTSASVEEIAESADVTIEDLMWMTTMMACPEPLGQ